MLYFVCFIVFLLSELKCDNLTTLTNAEIDQIVDTEVGSRAYLQCTPGTYFIDGQSDKYVECLPHGKWSGIISECKCKLSLLISRNKVIWKSNGILKLRFRRLLCRVYFLLELLRNMFCNSQHNLPKHPFYP